MSTTTPVYPSNVPTLKAFDILLDEADTSASDSIAPESGKGNAAVEAFLAKASRITAEKVGQKEAVEKLTELAADPEILASGPFQHLKNVKDELDDIFPFVTGRCFARLLAEPEGFNVNHCVYRTIFRVNTFGFPLAKKLYSETGNK